MTNRLRWVVWGLLPWLASVGWCADEPPVEWTPIFNGRDLDGWTPKIRYFPLGENYGETFRVADGLLQVRYDQYNNFKHGDQAERFGHLFYKTPYSHYQLRAEYRFVGTQVPGGPGWAIRNSGFMVHGQDPATMTIDQDFPVSIEVQLLGGLGQGKRTTANLCTPGTHVELNGKLHKPHCTSSTSPTFDGEQWVTVEIEARGSESIIHKINGEVVLSYQKPQLDEGDASAKRLLAEGAAVLIEGGTISVQSESHPIDFRKIEIRRLPQ